MKEAESGSYSERDRFIGTVTPEEEVGDMFSDARYFGGDEGHYTAKGMHVEVTQNGIEYDVDDSVDDKVVMEFVEGIVRSFEDVDDDFVPEVEQGVYETAEGVAANGGRIKSDGHYTENSGEWTPGIRVRDK